jgi:hypothetical protein
MNELGFTMMNLALSKRGILKKSVLCNFTKHRNLLTPRTDNTEDQCLLPLMVYMYILIHEKEFKTISQWHLEIRRFSCCLKRHGTIESWSSIV